MELNILREIIGEWWPNPSLLRSLQTMWTRTVNSGRT